VQSEKTASERASSSELRDAKEAETLSKSTEEEEEGEEEAEEEEGEEERLLAVLSSAARTVRTSDVRRRASRAGSLCIFTREHTQSSAATRAVLLHTT